MNLYRTRRASLLTEVLINVVVWIVLRVLVIEFFSFPDSNIDEVVLYIASPLCAVINIIHYHHDTLCEIAIECARLFRRPDENRADRNPRIPGLQRTDIPGLTSNERDRGVQGTFELLVAAETKRYLGYQRLLWQSLLDSRKRELSLLEGQSLQCQDLLESKKSELEANEKSVAAFGRLKGAFEGHTLLWKDILETQKKELALVERQKLQYQDLLENKKRQLKATETLVGAWMEVIVKQNW